jgi:hypothetical protein
MRLEIKLSSFLMGLSIISAQCISFCPIIFPKDAPEFYEKPKIQQKDGGKVIQIKIRAKSHIEMKSEWFKAS